MQEAAIAAAVEPGSLAQRVAKQRESFRAIRASQLVESHFVCDNIGLSSWGVAVTAPGVSSPCHSSIVMPSF
jgi:hypothetical protein